MRRDSAPPPGDEGQAPSRYDTPLWAVGAGSMVALVGLFGLISAARNRASGFWAGALWRRACLWLFVLLLLGMIGLGLDLVWAGVKGQSVSSWAGRF